jgi:para-aminobenzoate synthetase component 1
MLDGRGPVGADWGGPLVAVAPRVVLRHRAADGGGDPLVALQELADRRGAEGGGAGTGLVALLGYELGDRRPDPARDDDGLPEMLVLAVDASVRYPPNEAPRFECRSQEAEALLDAALERAGEPSSSTTTEVPRVSASTSLPREQYLRAVGAVQEHIRKGDCYQANLTQRFAAPFEGDPLALYRRLVSEGPAPRSAFVDFGDGALVSASPETFLRADPDGRVETLPIKGTRPRGADDETDRRRAEELRASEKDRAELLMIVDLERNDLGRVCRPGSVRVEGDLIGLESYPAVHHLVTRVAGRLRPEVGLSDLLGATFPGGSITGAPKLRVIEILRQLEPVRRNFYTGSLLWIGDDGTIESSILIRSIVTRGRRAWLGAGGGVVADSDPEQEWLESNHKARPLARALGFEPEEAG